tara:strand:+ start:16 stop:1176 length:1161 start_codon:yes stop_codon:yes gene_type:complete
METKVKEVEIYHYKYPIKNINFPCANHVLNGTIYFKILTNNKIIGYGEPSSYLGNYKIISKLIYNYIFPYLKDKEINKINLAIIKKKFIKKKNYLVINNLIAGLDQAIWDIKSKISNKNLSNFISKKNITNRKIGLYASGGMIFNDQSMEIISKEALKYKLMDFKGYKFRPPIPRKKLSHFDRIKNPPPIDIKKLIQDCKKIRSKVGNKFKLMLDLGCRINNLKDFYYLSDFLNELNFFFIEEPFKRDINIYKKIYNKSKTKISFGESLTNKKDFINWLKYIDILQPDSNMITISEIIGLKKLFKKSNKMVIFHNWGNPISMLSNFHLSSALDLKIIEYNVTYNPTINFFLKKKFKINKGDISISAKKGLGLNINYNFVKKYSKKI